MHTPVTGKATAEATPVASPWKKPFTPFCCAPATGWATSETAPAKTPLPMDFVAEESPAIPSLGRLVEKRELKTSLACNFSKEKFWNLI